MAELYDLAIIGGGIHGAALAELAAHNGYRVALLEKTDFGAGVTSRSTRLIHGGLRYLEHGHISVVRESLREREALLQEFPGQVAPLPFLIPVYEGDSRSPLWVRAGLEVYQWIGRSRLVSRHRQLAAAALLALEPGLKSAGLRGGFLYFDCQAIYPERLALDMALTAAAAGADVRNHTPVVGLVRAGGTVGGVVLEGGEEINARLVVNAAGPWADEVGRMALFGGSASRDGRRLLDLVGGVHIVTTSFPGAPSHAIYHEASADRRPFFVVPWRGLWLIGTTETPYRGDPDNVAPTEAEIDYLLRETNLLFPEAALAPDAVLYAYAGLRPLLTSNGRRPQEISRGHAIHDHEKEEGVGGMLTLLGGKLTTARAFAAQVLERVAVKLGREAVATWARPAWDPSRAPARLARIYGRRAEQIVSMARQQPALDRPICGVGETIAAEVVYTVRHEMASTLGDILLRRTGAAFDPCRGLDCAPQVARLAAPLLGWDERGIELALASYSQELQRTLHRGPRP